MTNLNILRSAFLACSAAFLLGIAGAPSECKVATIATYNLENFFDAHDDPYASDIDSYNNNALMIKNGDEVAAIADVLKQINADVIGLQEVENRGFLEEFNKKYLSELGYKYVELIEANDGRGIDVALLSRFPFGPVITYRHLELTVPYSDTPGKFSRDLLEVVVRPKDAQPFSVFVVHLKSRSGGKEATWQRIAEANKIRQVFDYRLKANPSARFILLGDMNDDAPSQTINILKGQGATAMTSVEAKAPDGSDWTQSSKYSTRYPPIRFDWIFVSPSLKSKVKSSKILRLPESSEQGRRIREASDHYPVIMKIDL